MSNPAAFTSALARNPFEVARSHLIRRLLEIKVPPASAIGEAPDHIREAANLFDEWLYAVGSQIADSVMVDVDMRQFSGAFVAAVDGNATYEAQCVAEESLRRRSYRRAV